MKQLILGTLALVALAQTSAFAACTGADPAIVAVSAKNMTSDGQVNRYAVNVRVTNLGRMNEPSNLLESVEIWQNDVKLDMKGLPPLKARQSYSFTYMYQRSADAGSGTSDLALHLTMRPHSGNVDCNPNNDNATITF